MNISRISKKRLKIALGLISREVRATRGARDQESSDAVTGRFMREARDARNRLLPLLQSAADLRDIDLILRIERGFLAWELNHLAKMPKKVSSLNMALRQLDAALNLLRAIRETETYQYARYAELFFTLPRNRIYGMPRDEAQQFFLSHSMRLYNLSGGRLEDTEAELLNARRSNIKEAQKLYTGLQRQALAPHEAREERALYLVS